MNTVVLDQSDASQHNECLATINPVPPQYSLYLHLGLELIPQFQFHHCFAVGGDKNVSTGHWA